MLITTENFDSIKPFIKKLYVPLPNSHKGQNGKLLIIGGSSLFHASPLWSAEIASKIVDMVHYASTEENNEIFLSLKKKFRNGIVVSQMDIVNYIKEDDAVLVGPGMVRTAEKFSPVEEYQIKTIGELNEIEHEGIKTYYLMKYLLENFPQQQFVIDAGALQMMRPEWLKKLKTKAIITPHQLEFERLFGKSIRKHNDKEKMLVVEDTARNFNVIIILKAVIDIISDGSKTYVIQGGNAGLTKGGTGDVLAGLVAAFATKNDPIVSALIASFLVKKTADNIFKNREVWFNTTDLLEKIPETIKEIRL